MEIQYVSLESEALWKADKNHSITFLRSFPESDAAADALVIQDGSEAQVLDFLIRLRSHAPSRFVPVFFLGQRPDLLQSLGDGLVNSPDKVVQRSRNLHERYSQLSEGLLDLGDEFVLLAYLYVHDVSLLPASRIADRQYYHYPLLDCLGIKASEAGHWLARLERDDLLSEKSLQDRVRCCPDCTGNHLNYVDMCGSCHSLRLAKTAFFHCFTCGHVAQEAEFVGEGRLVCPSCSTRLRHIGSDYDRALETWYCQDCQTRQNEPLITARCMGCQKLSEPADLNVQLIKTYALSQRGKFTVLLGAEDRVLESLDILSFMPYPVFMKMVYWQLMLTRRYEDLGFGIIGIRLPSLHVLGSRIGAGNAAAFFERFAQSLRELVRDTDLLSRADPTTLWLALPKTGAEGCRVLHERIRKLEHSAATTDNAPLSLATVYWSTEENTVPDNAETLFAALTEKLSGNAAS